MAVISANSTVESGDVRDLRRAAGLSQQRLAEMAECSVSMVRLVEAGYRPETHSAVLDRIAAVLTDEERPAGSPDALQNSAVAGPTDGSYSD